MSATSGIRKAKALLANLALATGSLALGLVCIEAYLRWQGAFESGTEPGCYVFSENPRLMYELAPHCSDTNSLGIRDREVGAAGAEIRIVALGDSITYGPGVTLDETWPNRLEHDLKRDGFDAAVFNLAVQGYSTVQEVETLRVKGLGLGPEIVILQYYGNDEQIYTTIFDGMIAAQRKRQGEGFLEALNPSRGWLARHLLFSRTAIAIRLAWDQMREAAAPENPADNPITAYYQDRSPVHEGLIALREIAAAHDLRVLVLVFPHAYGARADRVGGEALPELSEYPDAWVFDNASMFARCRELGFDCVDVAGKLAADPRFARMPGHWLFGDGCCHLTARGHKVAAQIARRELLARGWLDGRN